MNSLEWFKTKERALVNEAYSPAGYALCHPPTEQIPDDAPPPPSDADYVLLVAVYQGRVAHYWISQAEMDDTEVDVAPKMFLSINEQLGIDNA